jgi:hypothetical protein
MVKTRQSYLVVVIVNSGYQNLRGDAGNVLGGKVAQAEHLSPDEAIGLVVVGDWPLEVLSRHFRG